VAPRTHWWDSGPGIVGIDHSDPPKENREGFLHPKTRSPERGRKLFQARWSNSSFQQIQDLPVPPNPAPKPVGCLSSNPCRYPAFPLVGVLRIFAGACRPNCGNPCPKRNWTLGRSNPRGPGEPNANSSSPGQRRSARLVGCNSGLVWPLCRGTSSPSCHGGLAR